MGFWSNILRGPQKTADNPGDPDGVELQGDWAQTESRALGAVLPSPWDGWPSDWGMPNWDFGSRYNELVDVAWACLDLNASVLSAMPVYRTRGGEIIEPATWMTNPDWTIYESWEEFANQLFWDYMLGEAFVLPMAFFSDGMPMRFRVIPPWLMHVEMAGAQRVYRLGGPGGRDVTGEILHIRYRAASTDARGRGPLESAGGRMLTAGILAKYVRETAEQGGVIAQTLETSEELEPSEAQEMQKMWVESRKLSLAAPPVLDKNVKLETHHPMSPRDMAMLEIAQFTESRIAVLIGVPPFLVGLPATGGGAGESVTYSNVSQIFDFHDRSSLRPKAKRVMRALSGWALPRGQAAELNRDEYSRPSFGDRAEALVKLVDARIMTVEEARLSERLTGQAPTVALTGGDT
jgi:phage portal protein BeeE